MRCYAMLGGIMAPYGMAILKSVEAAATASLKQSNTCESVKTREILCYSAAIEAWQPRWYSALLKSVP